MALSGVALAGAVSCFSGGSNPGPQASSGTTLPSGSPTGGAMGAEASGSGGAATSPSDGTGGTSVPIATGGARGPGAGSGGSIPRTCNETTGTGGAGAGAAGTSTACPGTAGPTMVRLPDGYCIDSTEVSRAQYEAWLATTPSTSGQAGGCAWNTTFSPDSTCLGQRNSCFDSNADCGGFPQACIDWCDAAAFCKAAGKRLCGRIGGGPNPTSAYADASQSQWYGACASGAAHDTYATGAALDCQCLGPEQYPAAAVDRHQCQSPVGGYSGVYDLSGNVWEWEDSCDGAAGEQDNCHKRGGSFGGSIWDRAGSERCDDPAMEARKFADVNLGFRCCAD